MSIDPTYTGPPIAAAPDPEPAKPTVTEALESLTGYDELAIEKAFGADITTLGRTNPMTFSRALLFAGFLHDGDKHEAAKKRALDLTMKQVNESFADDPDDDPDLPGSESGKDEA